MAQRIGQPSYLVRTVVLVAASLVAVWFAVGLRDVKLQDRAIAMLVGPHPEPGRALPLLRDAKTLNASTLPELLSVGAYWSDGRRTLAVSRLHRLLRAHPDIVSAWALLARYLKDTDPAGAARARQRARALNGVKIKPA